MGAARASRLRFELDAQQRVVRAQVRAAFAVYLGQVAAAEELDREVLPRLDENETLSQRSYEAGQLSLPDLLLIRRETFDTRRAHQDRLLDAILAGVELEAGAGVLR
jgi:cobalt-zinc-cadmium efflux system outer membrane protein